MDQKGWRKKKECPLAWNKHELYQSTESVLAQYIYHTRTIRFGRFGYDKCVPYRLPVDADWLSDYCDDMCTTWNECNKNPWVEITTLKTTANRMNTESDSHTHTLHTKQFMADACSPAQHIPTRKHAHNFFCDAIIICPKRGRNTRRCVCVCAILLGDASQLNSARPNDLFAFFACADCSLRVSPLACLCLRCCCWKARACFGGAP